jgi:hypothetical protein
MQGVFMLMFFVIVVGIPVVGGLWYGAYERTLKHREKMAELLAAQTAEKAAQYAAQTERLEQRVRVLERIVTDRGIDVADEIERLRDQPN